MTTLTAGLSPLLRLALRRDRIMLPVWLYALIATVAGTAFSIRKLYPDQASRDRLAASINGNPSLRALYGPLYDTHSLGAVVAWRALPYGGLMIGLLCLLLVTRHTRAEEEAGRLELLGAGAVGRGTALSAALTTAAVSCATVGAVATVVLLTLGEAASGSLALGLAYAATGLLFAGVAALAAQVARTGRAANGLGGALLGLAFLLRTVGDAAGPHGAGHWLVWLSPIGWAEQVQPFAADRWWVLLLQLVVAAAEMTGAYALLLRRDHGAGLLPDRPGPADAPSSLRGAAGLAWRLQRAGLWGWTAALLVSGLVLGAITDGVRQLVDDSAQVAQMMERMGGTTGVVDSYLSTCMTFLAMASAAYAVQSTLRLRGEETGGRAEPLLAGAVGRLSWAAGLLAYPLAGSAALLLAGGLGAGLGTGAVLGDAGTWTGRLLGAALVQVPAVWLFAGFGTALFGLLPRWTTAAWGVLGVALLIAYLGPVVDAGQWLLDLTPFTHVPRLPGGELRTAPLVWLVLLSAALLGAGLAGLRRRDVG
ncbi:ABC transporter permease [Streptacidiphilus monticola]|uniref:ABC transporter permease n=1 Tax=Streptacidiphilus monticola TaxID=2161674 RepID=A0ABW1G3V8_9ACTN